MAVFVAVDGATGKITGSHSSKKPVLPQLMAPILLQFHMLVNYKLGRTKHTAVAEIQDHRVTAVLVSVHLFIYDNICYGVAIVVMVDL
jgi:hypothetical protein